MADRTKGLTIIASLTIAAAFMWSVAYDAFQEPRGFGDGIAFIASGAAAVFFSFLVVVGVSAEFFPTQTKRNEPT